MDTHSPDVRRGAAAAVAADLTEIRNGLAEAELPPLLPALAYLTGDLSLLRPELRADPELALYEQGGLTAEQQDNIRLLADDVLGRFAAGQLEQLPITRHELRAIAGYAAGGGAKDSQLDFLEEELGLPEARRRGPAWRKEEIDRDRPFSVAIVGAGMSGLLIAHLLGEAGVDYVVFDKNSDVGGTWLENTYPGCRVDVISHAYSYSFAQNYDWPEHYSPQSALLDYFRQVAADSDILPHVRFETEVVAAAFDDATSTWKIKIRGPEGEEEIRADVFVSAVGQLNRPKLPDIAGMSEFAGPSFHSALWDHDAVLAGKRVAVIGTGASAVQIIPAIAESASHVVVLQRTPNWFFPEPRYHQQISQGLRCLLETLPSYAQWYRFWQMWQGTETLLEHCRVDPAWEGKNGAVSALNDEVRQFLTSYLETELAERPELAAMVVPTYAPSAKRVLLDDGTWTSCLKRPNVQLVTESIDRITADSVVTSDGAAHRVDAIVYATGFDASNFLASLAVTGRRGRDLHATWGGDARAYLGVGVPDFPNLFMLYGPNTNIVINATTIFYVECEARLILECIRLLLESGHRAMSPRQDVHDEYNRWIDEGNRNMVWGATAVNSWYKNRFGRVAQNWPFGMLEYWERTREPDPADFEFC